MDAQQQQLPPQLDSTSHRYHSCTINHAHTLANTSSLALLWSLQFSLCWSPGIQPQHSTCWPPALAHKPVPKDASRVSLLRRSSWRQPRRRCPIPTRAMQAQHNGAHSHTPPATRCKIRLISNIVSHYDHAWPRGGPLSEAIIVVTPKPTAGWADVVTAPPPRGHRPPSFPQEGLGRVPTRIQATVACRSCR